MNKYRRGLGRLSASRIIPLGAAVIAGGLVALNATAWQSSDGSLELHGYADSTTHTRGNGGGLTKQRFRGQIEWAKSIGSVGPFTGVSFHGTLRAVYDGVYDLNADDYGDEAGGAVFGSSSGLPTFLPFCNGRDYAALGCQTSWGTSPVTAGNPALPGGGGFGFDLTRNPNTGLKKVGQELGFRNNGGQFGGGLEFFTPVRPCNDDPRGCISDYLDFDDDDLAFPEFRDDHRWLREAYVDATLPFSNGDEINFRVGRQQVVWGRTDLFRVLDQINPIDFSIQNIYEEFEDSRIPLGIFSAEWRLGAAGIFEDLNFQFVYNFEKFQPHILGQGGQPYNILLAGDLFRALSNCYHNGCTVSNFATGLVPDGNLATDFPAHVVGIRRADLPQGHDQFGLRMEGVFKSVGFSVNALYYWSQLPSLRGGIPIRNPFIGPGTANPFDPSDAFGVERPRPFVPAFDIHFPRVLLVGGSADFYVDPIKSAFRVEVAWTEGEEFADTSKPRLFSESDVVRWVVGWDRPTYIKFLNPNRTFLLSGQMFGQHLLDHERFGSPITGAPIGFQDWDHNFIFTFLIQGFYMNDRLQPRLITAYDTRAQAGVLSPGVDWLFNNNWRLIVAANVKFGHAKNNADDGRTANSFPPFTAGPACPLPPVGAPAPGCFPGGGEFPSIGVRNGYEPLGRFRSGPIGMAQHEDEIQVLLRYQF